MSKFLIRVSESICDLQLCKIVKGLNSVLNFSVVSFYWQMFTLANFVPHYSVATCLKGCQSKTTMTLSRSLNSLSVHWMRSCLKLLLSCLYLTDPDLAKLSLWHTTEFWDFKSNACCLYDFYKEFLIYMEVNIDGKWLDKKLSMM